MAKFGTRDATRCTAATRAFCGVTTRGATRAMMSVGRPATRAATRGNR